MTTNISKPWKSRAATSNTRVCQNFTGSLFQNRLTLSLAANSATEMQFRVTNTAAGVLRAVPNFYRYTASNPNYALGVSGEITVNPAPVIIPPPGPVKLPDTQPPTTNITAPANNSRVNRATQVTIKATASDNVGVNKVEFYVNNALTCTDKTAPYTCGWSVPRKMNLKYNLQSKGYDAKGNTGVSKVMSVISK